MLSSTNGGGLPRLPSELLWAIFELAASEDRHSAHALAYVSRDACYCTAGLRWRTVVLTTQKQVTNFWEVLLACEEARHEGIPRTSILREDEAMIMQQKIGRRVPREGLVSNWISLPSATPGAFVENLFVELLEDEFPEVCRKIDHARNTRSELQAELLSSREGDDAPSWSEIQQVRLGTSGPTQLLAGLLHHVPNLIRLALGAAEAEVLSRSLQAVSPRELSLAYDGNEYALSEMLLWSSESDVPEWTRSAGDRHGSYSARPFFGGLRRRLTHLHIVGLDQRSSVTGVEMPVKYLAPLCAGSVESRSLLRSLTGPAGPTWELLKRNFEDPPSTDHPQHRARTGWARLASTKDTSLGITHLRFDTRRFEFRPPEVFAMRLRPFFTSLRCSEGTAPMRRRYEEVLKSWGVGDLTRLHLSWDQAPAAGIMTAEEVPWYRRARFAKVDHTSSWPATAGFNNGPNGGPTDSNGGWPREPKDVWTERSDRDIAPTFQAELAQAIQSKFGWNPPKPKFRPTVPKLSSDIASSDDAEVPKYGDVRSDVDEFVSLHAGEMVERIVAQSTDEGSILPMISAAVERELEERAVILSAMSKDGAGIDDSIADTSTAPILSYAVRAPSRLLRLGGVASFTREQRVALFLDRVRGGPGAWD